MISFLQGPEYQKRIEARAARFAQSAAAPSATAAVAPAVSAAPVVNPFSAPKAAAAPTPAVVEVNIFVVYDCLFCYSTFRHPFSIGSAP